MLALAGLGQVALAQSAFRDDHESGAPAWQRGAADTRYRLERQARVQDAARSGETCETISIAAGIGSYVYFSYPVGQARVIDELRPTMWMKSQRQGLQVLARIVLPRTLDPATGSAATVLVRGETYTQVGQWQMLAVEGLPKALDDQVRVLRARLGPKVDPREAYVDQVVVNLYGGQGRTTVWLDDLDVAGFVGRRPDQAKADVVITEPKTDNTTAGSSRKVELQNDVLLVGGKPFFPRAVAYRGEPLGELAAIGFNTLWLSRPATVEFVADARRAGFWIVCPPPDPLPESIGGAYDGVLAWNLGHHLSLVELDAVTQLAALLRKRDARQRPLVAQADSQVRAYSRVADVLLVDKPVLGTSLELADYARYVGERPQLSRPGTPFWTAVDLDLDSRVVHQIESLLPGRMRKTAFDAAAVRQATIVGLSAGARGMLFNTHARIGLRERVADGSAAAQAGERDVVSVRAMELALLNRELQLCEPWLAEGQRAATARDRDAQAAITLIQNRRGKLLFATRVLPGGQFAPGSHPKGTIALVAPGSPETEDAFVLSAAGLRSLERRRVAGGTSLVWDGFGGCGMAVLSSDTLLMTSLNRQALTTVRTTAGWKIAVVRRALAEAEANAAQLGDLAPASPQATRRAAAAQIDAAQALDAARSALRLAEQRLAAGNAAAAYRAAEAAASAAALWQRAAWEQSVRGWPSPVASPFAVTPATLVDQSRMADRVSRAVVGRNSLAEGDCENLPAMIDAGWKHWQHRLAGIETHVELSPTAPFAGQSSLLVSATASDPTMSATLIETPPVWVVTAPVQFGADTAVRIRGRVRIVKPITGSVDGLEIIDSLGGPALATRIGHAPEWQEFALYRFATRLDQITVTFAMSGIGEAWIDNVAIEPMTLPAGQGAPVQFPGARPQASAALNGLPTRK